MDNCARQLKQAEKLKICKQALVFLKRYLPFKRDGEIKLPCRIFMKELFVCFFASAVTKKNLLQPNLHFAEKFPHVCFLKIGLLFLFNNLGSLFVCL